MAELLIQKGADVNIAGEIGNRALTHSAEKGKRNCISNHNSDRSMWKYLKRKDNAPYCFNDSGRKNITKLLLEHGADIDAVNEYNNSALIMAVWAGNFWTYSGKVVIQWTVPTLFLEFDNVAEFLIQKGADVNVVGENGYTALMWAAQKGEEIFQTPNYWMFC